VLYPDGSGDFQTIQAAVNAATHGDTIQLGVGSFEGDGNRDVQVLGKDIVLRGVNGSAATTIDVQNHGCPAITVGDLEQATSPTLEGITVLNATTGIDLYLGNATIRDIVFAGNSEEGVRISFTSPAIRNCSFDGDGIRIAFIDGLAKGGISPPSYDGLERSAVVDSCTFANADVAIDDSYGMAYGLTISNSTFSNNAFAVRSGSGYVIPGFTYQDCVFSDNGIAIQQPCTLVDCEIAGGDYGIVHAHSGSAYDIRQSSFSGLTTAVTAGYGQFVFEDCVFSENADLIVGTSVYEDPLEVTIVSCDFVDNAGGISFWGDDETIHIEDCTYSRNAAPISLTGWGPVAGFSISSCEFENNEGAALVVTQPDSPTLNITECLFSRNGSNPLEISLGIDGTLVVSNCTLTDNMGSGIVVTGAADGVISNTIVDQNAGFGVDVDCTGILTFEANDAWGNADGDYNGVMDPTGQDGNISADPVYCDPDSSNFHIAAISPCSPDSSEYGLIGALDVGCEYGPAYVDYDPEDGLTVHSLWMGPCAPSPFDGQTTVELAVPSCANGQRVELAVFDLAGRQVRSLINGPTQPGLYHIGWDGHDDQGSLVSSGCYFFRLSQGGTTISRSAVILR